MIDAGMQDNRIKVCEVIQSILLSMGKSIGRNEQWQVIDLAGSITNNSYPWNVSSRFCRFKYNTPLRATMQMN